MPFNMHQRNANLEKTMKQPHEYEKRILLAVSGMSPQILTETLYAIAIAEKETPFIPTEIHLISTSEGTERAILELLHPMTGKFHQLCRDYGLTGIEFSQQNVYAIEDKDGTVLSDIKTPEDNEAAADFITEIVSNLTRDNESALHVSMAGGRKTMGYYLGYALSLYGRAQDRLSHVLISENYESLPTFFYPTVESFVIYDRNGKPLDTQKAEVMLAEIPFVRLRTGLPEHLLNRKAGFSESVSLARSFEATPTLTIDFKDRCFYARSVKVQMSNVNFAFYVWMIEQTVNSNTALSRPSKADRNQHYIDSFLVVYEKYSSEGEREKVIAGFKTEGMTGNWLSERITAVKKSFERALGQTAASSYCIKTQGKNSNLSYVIALKPNQIF
jgi:CRISPR-associated protein (TIGR02584 family)